MSNTIISEGKTTAEAIENGLKILKVSKDAVEVKVLEDKEKRSFFSILTPRVVKVELTLKENNNENKQEEKVSLELEKDVFKQNNEKKEPINLSIEEQEKAKTNIYNFLEELSKKIEEEFKFEIIQDEKYMNVNITGSGSIFLIGYRGETLYSFQNILTTIASKGINSRVKVILDIENFKTKRKKTLEELAEKIAKSVEKTGKSLTLEPMQAYERKIIHSKLQDSNKVATKSIGEEPRRRVVVFLKNNYNK